MNLQKIITDLETRIAKAEKWLVDNNMALGYVVGRDGLFLKNVGFDSNGNTTGEHNTTSYPDQADVFKGSEARKLARITRNGNGFFEVYGQAAAVKATIDTNKEHVKSWKDLV
jgi:hypothetical protein